MNFEIAYDDTLDSLITDKDILNICSKVSGQSKGEVFHDQKFGKVMFKNISEKDYDGWVFTHNLKLMIRNQTITVTIIAVFNVISKCYVIYLF